MIDDALQKPIWQLSLGRKSFVPAEPVYLPSTSFGIANLQDNALQGALEVFPWLGNLDGRRKEPPAQVRVVVEETGPSEDIRRDVPLSFAERSFGLRSVRTSWLRTVWRDGYVSFTPAS